MIIRQSPGRFLLLIGAIARRLPVPPRLHTRSRPSDGAAAARGRRQVGPMDTELRFDSDGFRVVVDPKSLMFVYGMTLDYSDDLIGGGFKFNNPNAASTCGCGQSFGA